MSRLQDWEIPIARIAEENLQPRWHPKITIYRLLMLSTTLGFGTAKVITAYQQKSYVSTTIEWVSGVAVFLVFFLVNIVEGDPSQKGQLGWLLQYDTLELLWSIFKILGRDRPRYRSDERQVEFPERHPPITGFRILTTLTVILFGSIKAYLSYSGFSNAATAMDWISGVVISSTLYCLSLYENNTSNKLSYLFSTNYNAVIFSGGWLCFQIALCAIGIALGVVWSLGWNLALNTTPDGLLDFGDGGMSEGPLSSLGHIHDLSMEYTVQGVVWLVILVGPMISSLSLWTMITLPRVLGPIKKVGRVVRRLTRAISTPIRLILLKVTVPQWAEGIVAKVSAAYQFIRRFGVHTLVFICAIILCAFPTFAFLGFALRILSPIEKRAEFVPDNIVVGTLRFFIAGAAGGGFGIGMVFFAYCLIRPLYMDRNFSYYEKTLLEF
ncbi:hypothetical protein GALMADRAFT_91662 [Galerina marginata CBS 339.88]|uniref:Uncharacterized protein n=1 Tax=Galerina marginata (strain CBS 339.88) TaxID=685588 RepID=A0A067TCX6_GALM3|nr:hypothetical protein GALMADRAFT_91662 [Galerina marginata CBS 339.88]